jgi:hypothetical protein
MTVWITACERDSAPYTVYPGGTWQNAPCNSAEIRSIQIEDKLPPLDPHLLAQAFAAGFVPILFCFAASRAIGTVINMVRSR